MENYSLINADGLEDGVVKGRSVREGYSRGWGLQFNDLREKVARDPVYRDAVALAAGRTVQAEDCRMNLYLIVRFYLSQIPEGDIIEFGSFKGGSALFMAAVVKASGLASHVWALDSFAGMPETDPSIDLHRKGDFEGVDYDELVGFARAQGLDNLTFVRGLFEDTTDGVLAQSRDFALAHIDCDIKSAVAYSYEKVRDRMVDGGYIAFDDAHYSSCLGATEVVEDLVIRRDGLNSEQIFPHFVFRRWRAGA